MTRSLIVLSLMIVLVFPLCLDAEAEMESENYRIPASVLSGGGETTSDSSRSMNGSIGQPTPLADRQDPPTSENYENHPGFWETIGEESNVSCDISGDGQITPMDALCAFQKYLLVCPTECGACDDTGCDVNGDGSCTPGDALEIFKAYLGIVPNACSVSP